MVVATDGNKSSERAFCLICKFSIALSLIKNDLHALARGVKKKPFSENREGLKVLLDYECCIFDQFAVQEDLRVINPFAHGGYRDHIVQGRQ